MIYRPDQRSIAELLRVNLSRSCAGRAVTSVEQAGSALRLTAASKVADEEVCRWLETQGTGGPDAFNDLELAWIKEHLTEVRRVIDIAEAACD